MRVHPERMRANLELTHGALFSQGVLNALVESGMTRDDAYRIVQENAQRAWDEGRSFRELLEQEGEVTKRLDSDRLDELFDYARFVRHEPEILKRLGRC
jgi:adenylosuccinate lyase